MNKRIKSLVLGASLVASMAVLGGCGSNKMLNKQVKLQQLILRKVHNN